MRAEDVTSRRPWLARRWRVLAVGVVALVIMCFVRCFDPAVHRFYPPCLWNRLTGWQCAGCGATRALYHLTRGEWAEAFRLNPGFVAALPVLAVIALFRRRWFDTSRFWFGLLAVLALFTVLRNLKNWL